MKTLMNVFLAGLLSIAGAVSDVRADDYPARPIRIIVPNAAGGVLDIAARKIMDKLSKSMGQPVIIDNRPGANGLIAAEAAARSKPDGYTLFMGATNHLCINPSLFSSLPYHPLRDFAPVTLGASGQPILLTNPRLPSRTLSEFIAHAKARPGQVTYGSPGVGSPQHLAMELFEQLTGADLVHVPYKNHPQVLTDLIGGQIDSAVEYASMAAPHLQAGKLQGLAIVGSRRKPAVPDIPTAAEAGLPGFETTAWYGYLVPAGTPREIIARLHKDLTAALKSKEYVEFVESFGSSVVASTPEEFATTIKLEQTRWARIIAQAGVRLD
jgi:tripartite-type tricarboxylate transporter receptor subunit TctC